jgi:hypothetical protein
MNTLVCGLSIAANEHIPTIQKIEPMKTQKVKVQKTEYVDVEIPNPFYAYYEDDDESVFYMKTDREYKKITVYMFGLIEIITGKSYREIPELMLESQCDWQQWQEGVRMAKECTMKL